VRKRSIYPLPNVANNDRAAYQAALQGYLDEQAGVLGERLKENEPCPVCGSLSHPHPAKKKETVLSREEIAALKEKADRSDAHSKALASLAEAKKATVKEKELSLSKAFASLSSHPLVIEAFDDSVKELEQANALATSSAKLVLADIAQKKAAHEEAKHALKLAEETLHQDQVLEQAALEAKEKAASIEAAAASLVTSLSSETQGLDLGSIEESLRKLEESLTKDEAGITRLEEAYSSAKSHYDSLLDQKKANDTLLPHKQEELLASQASFASLLEEQHFASLEEASKASLSPEVMAELEQESERYHQEVSGVLALLQEGKSKGYDTLAVVDESAFPALEEEARALALSTANATNALASKLKANEASLENIALRRKASKEAYTKASEIHLLYQTASGKLTGGSAHIDFEVYYQAQIFEEILASASKKFSIMSDGRYTLVRRDVPTSNSGSFGLDIDVKDFQTGKIRPASSLSGGESFMASLSLALSLSEIIQQKAGGIELDSMFIDEGFGTLDPDSLALAIRVLTALSNNSHRLIGIISHVETLKNAIPAQIEVSKSSKGSSLTCHYE
jgi:exonuclease SbcC